MKKESTWMTAAELEKELSKKEDYNNMMQEKERKTAELRHFLLLEQKPLLQDLEVVGISVTSVWDLVKCKKRYDCAIPVLLKHLSLSYHPRTLEGIARALGRPWAREQAWDFVLDVLNKKADESAEPQEGLYEAIRCMASAKDVPVLLALLRKKELGPNRLFFLYALKRLAPSVLPQIFRELEDDMEMSMAIKDINKWLVKRKKGGKDL